MTPPTWTAIAKPITKKQNRGKSLGPNIVGPADMDCAGKTDHKKRPESRQILGAQHR